MIHHPLSRSVEDPRALFQLFQPTLEDFDLHRLRDRRQDVCARPRDLGRHTLIAQIDIKARELPAHRMQTVQPADSQDWGGRRGIKILCVSGHLDCSSGTKSSIVSDHALKFAHRHQPPATDLDTFDVATRESPIDGR